MLNGQLSMKELLSFKGRASRKTFWIISLTLLAIVLIIGLLEKMMGGEGTITGIAILASFWPNLAVQIKRWHDRDKSGWWALLHFVPVIGTIWILIENGFLAGTAGDNRFGSAPKQ